ncbi:MAG: acyl-CoA dehydrogenase family protein [Deltaproteobacteria bacterium]|nr:acyl-CoA dehydrogenase family protein [Deltaproteobacteria bacterium]
MGSLDAETLDAVIETLDHYAKNALTDPTLLELDARDEFPHEVLKALYDPATIGLHLLFLPEEVGGFGGGAVAIARIAEKMASIDLGLSTGILATFLGTDPIRVGGTPEQKAHWMGRIAEEGLVVAYGATEPQAGSDLSALRTRAERVYEGETLVGYRISGQKQWISNGGVASLYTILALTPSGPSWFVVERGAEGFSYGKPEVKHGIRASNTAALFLENVFVTPDRLVGEQEGQGLRQAQAVFGYTRLMVAAFGLGAGWAALERAVRYAQTRVQGGGPLAEKQGYTHKLLVPNAARLEAARAYIEWTAERIDAGEEALATEGAVAKYMATEAGNRAAEDAIQALGGYGYTKEYMVEKIKRDVRITTIYEGTSEIMEWTIARDRWQLHLKTQGAYYRDMATRMDALHIEHPDVGAAAAAMALRHLAAVLERCRTGRLTRNQHVLFRIGELIAWAETAAVFAERVATAPSPRTGLPVEALRAFARIHARDAAQRVAAEGLRWTIASTPTGVELPDGIDLGAALRLQAGLVPDMDLAASSLIATFPADA